MERAIWNPIPRCANQYYSTVIQRLHLWELSLKHAFVKVRLLPDNNITLESAYII